MDKIDSQVEDQLIEIVIILANCSIEENQSYLTAELIDLLNEISNKNFKCSILCNKKWDKLTQLLTKCLNSNLKEAITSISLLMG